MAKYSALKKTADSLIAKFGTTFIIEREGSSSNWTKKYNPETMEHYWEDSSGTISTTLPADIPTQITGTVVIGDWVQNLVDGSTIIQGDKMLIVSCDELVQLGDVMVFSAGVSYTLVAPLKVTDPANDGHVVQEVNGRNG